MRLDHPKRVIQGFAAFVVGDMHAVPELACLDLLHASRMMEGEGCSTPPLARPVAVQMPSEYERTATPTDFAGLIVAIARDKDRSAFAELFEHFAPRVKTLMLRMGASRDRAEELAQETLLTVWNKAQLFDPKGASASGWIFRIARNLRIDGLRRDRRLDALNLDPTDDHSEVRQPDRIVSAMQSETRVRSAVSNLNPEQLQVITLSFFEDRPHAEISEFLQLPLGTVKSRILLGMNKLRQALSA
jgi:RNA polymerase sigma-70 factor, ECF subfamily